MCVIFCTASGVGPPLGRVTAGGFVVRTALWLLGLWRCVFFVLVVIVKLVLEPLPNAAWQECLWPVYVFRYFCDSGVVLGGGGESTNAID